MPRPGGCWVCVLTLCLCIFGSMIASTGVSLLMNYELFGRNSSTPRTFPPGSWNQTMGIALTSVGSAMFLIGMTISFCCLSLGTSDKLRDKSNKYDLFHNEDDITRSVSFGPELTTNSYGNQSNETWDTSDKKLSSDEYAYDVTFQDDDIMKSLPSEDSIPPEIPQINPGQTIEYKKTIKSILKSLSVPEDRTVSTGYGEGIGEPHIDYPKVVLDDSHIVDVFPNEGNPLHSSSA